MINGLYQSAAGMLTQMVHHEAIAGNLASTSAAGYRRNQVAFETYLDPKQKAAPDPKTLSQTANNLWPAKFPTVKTSVDFSQGHIEADGNNTHLALIGSGFFAVELPDNQGTAYTRNGAFHVTSRGDLVTNDGWKVLSDGGAGISVPKPHLPILVGEDGDISQGGGSLGKVKIVNFKEPTQALDWTGGGFFFLKDPNMEPDSKPSETRVVQGSVETSNVNLVQEMVAMIQATRSYEANQKMLQAQDESLEQIIRQVPSNT
jgi:flagellar basal body rod protein FlgG